MSSFGPASAMPMLSPQLISSGPYSHGHRQDCLEAMSDRLCFGHGSDLFADDDELVAGPSGCDVAVS